MILTRAHRLHLLLAVLMAIKIVPDAKLVIEVSASFLKAALQISKLNDAFGSLCIAIHNDPKLPFSVSA